MYNPDNWVIIKINVDEPFYKVLAGWSGGLRTGGYLDGDSWRMNSGIEKVIEEYEHYLFHGASGSVYRCHKDSEQLRMNNIHVWEQMKEMHGDKVELVEFKDTDLVATKSPLLW